MTEPTAGSNGERPGNIESLPWWTRPGKLAWLGLTGGLGFGLMLLASLGVALARALAQIMGGPQGLALGFFALALAAMLVIPPHLALVYYLGKELDQGLDRQTSAQQGSGDPSRSFRMSNEVYWVIGCLGLIAGCGTGYVVGAILGLASGKEFFETLVPQLLAMFLGVFSISALFVLTRGTDGLNPDKEAEPNE